MTRREKPVRARLEGWPERLAELVASRRGTPFTWGEHDCCLFAADAVLAITGADPAAAFRGYSSEAEADQVLGEAGLEGTVAGALEAFGAGACHPGFAQRGDLALVVLGNQPTLMVVVGDQLAGPGPEGLVFLPLQRALRAWSI